MAADHEEPIRQAMAECTCPTASSDMTNAKLSHKLPHNWSRLALTWVMPTVDDGRWPVKRSLGEAIDVRAGVIVDGQDRISVELVFRHECDEADTIRPMAFVHNDEYESTFNADRLGRYLFCIRARIDAFMTWQDQFRRRVEGNDDPREIASELAVGASLLRKAADRARVAEETKAAEEAGPTDEADAGDRATLLASAEALEQGDAETALQRAVLELAQAHDPREDSIESNLYEVCVDPVHARFAAWYEFFPRSAPTRRKTGHATLDDAAQLLPRIRELGFDVVYLPPVHPIGHTHRKGKDNAPSAQPGDPGSPWAIGSEAGGHKAVHPDLGGLEAFDRFVARAAELDLHVAIDIALQTSPDHPYVREHAEWFRQRADGSIRYAENPPKKYQDVYPFDFSEQHREPLWIELRSIFEFWIEHGIRIFRVDNPHTKPFDFWAWCIGTLRAEHPDLIFLAEAFTRPKIMYHLAKLGFNNSYTYFTWRNTKEEITTYGQELHHSDLADFFRPNLWPNTPDILHDYLVQGGRLAHVVRFVLAATLSPTYGLYGPPFEHVDNTPHPDREEYANNEKYEIRSWNWNDPDSLQPLIQRVNHVRRNNPALQYMRNVRFLDTDGPHLLAYARCHRDNRLIIVAHLDPQRTRERSLSLPLTELGLPEGQPCQLVELLGQETVRLHGQDSQHAIRFSSDEYPVRIYRIEREETKHALA